jgi:hypothetical protein
MAKKGSKAQGARTKRRPSKTQDLPVDRKARTVKGGAFNAYFGDGSVRATLRPGTLPGNVSRNTI